MVYLPAGLASPKLRKGAAGRFQSSVMVVQLGLFLSSGISLAIILLHGLN